MTEKTLTTENIKPALDALRGELAPWPVVAMKQDKLNNTQKSAVNSGITSSLVAQIIANTAAIRALESAITGTGLRALVVASLPAVGTTGILYIVPVTTYDPETDADVVNYSNEYIWIPVEGGTASEGHYEQVGQTGIVINNGQLTITVNGTSVGTFTANQSGNTTAAITVPTNADYVDRTTDQTVAGVKTFSSTIIGTAAKAIADEDGTSIKTGYVNVAGNQTVSGQKTFSNDTFFTSSVYQKDTTYEIGNTPASNVVIQDYFVDKNNAYTGYVRNVVLTSGRTQTELRVRNKFTSGALSPTGTNVSSSLQVEVQSNGDKTLYFDGSIRNNVLPYTTNTYTLGSSSYQWSSVYAQSYYYNGTQWGLDRDNTWTGTNTFSKDNLGTQTVYTLGTLPQAEDAQALLSGRTTDSNFVTGIYFYQSPTRGTGLRLTIRNKWDSNGYSTTGTTCNAHFEFLQGADRTAYIQWQGYVDNGLYPLANNTYDLGTSTNKWKTLNGVNPGALSLPDFTSETGVSLSAGANTYTPTFSGWLSISTTGDISVVCGNFCHKATDMISVPVIAGKTYTVTMPASATGYFYPCLGDV